MIPFPPKEERIEVSSNSVILPTASWWEASLILWVPLTFHGCAGNVRYVQEPCFSGDNIRARPALTTAWQEEGGPSSRQSAGAPSVSLSLNCRTEVPGQPRPSQARTSFFVKIYIFFFLRIKGTERTRSSSLRT